ncbi:bifunctional UDP-N-acetylglucosamine diphosphorylase/glucosamine-1-phosphate N-acetyltransferase GlmU [Marinobacterium sediminicola]|uniref:Bifunctional protein GlmU n=1 Tax=Marinobacterium sediminicola TaxID=518898 RepID=A0ABY1S4G5_9GAMM|nr:bifunctional UDP-N-acetylglucosamine diphosphorylase/glucosamine-1-phosphate N-acetyltransferase GlmU [Marinobacterium sediminicola]ULG69213.1 bifunctional UDP-N-acetylglucosamine diphosphorylase/glucosamine-1-phosphate N-acetyltransferase GlmU [Marinobacterium sediminicola]SMR78304.1 UDP-N-acetylglucosamine pyrophosphorylase /glucosamine-1-phosphate N-acetyltransferase [Marinobacterium sediminicola]
MKTDVVILAAGQGSRMKSAMPKVMHRLAGKPMLQHVIDSAQRLAPEAMHVVIGHEGEQVEQAMSGQPLNFVWQREQLGTGHAVAQAMPNIGQDSVVLVLYGDVPMTRPETLQQLIKIAAQGDLGLLTVTLDDPTGYGRIIRNAVGDVVAIVEHKDATEQERLIREVNTGILALPSAALHEWLPRLSADNAQGEYYLTDVIAMAAEEGMRVRAIQPEAEQEVQGVNNRQQLAQLERWYQRQQAEQLMTDGVTLADPERIDIRGELRTGRDVLIDINTVFEGEVVLGEGVEIGANCIIRNARIGAGTRVEANSIIDGAVVAENAQIGPFARLRPGTELAVGSKVGNFVETKKARIGEGSKVNHLTYIGDAEIGRNVNVGAGTITCNYDGVNKSQTKIGDGAFIGSNSSLVAPVEIGAGATVGAGSTVTKTVADNQLAVARGKQINLDNWARPKKKGS